MIIYQEKSDLWLVSTSSVMKLMIQVWFQIRRRSNCNLSNRELVRGYHLQATEIGLRPRTGHHSVRGEGCLYLTRQNPVLTVACASGCCSKKLGELQPIFSQRRQEKVLVFFPLR